MGPGSPDNSKLGYRFRRMKLKLLTGRLPVACAPVWLLALLVPSHLRGQASATPAAGSTESQAPSPFKVVNEAIPSWLRFCGEFRDRAEGRTAYSFKTGVDDTYDLTRARLPGQNLYGAYASFTDAVPKFTFQPYFLWNTLSHVKSEENHAGNAEICTADFRWVGNLPTRFDYAAEMAKQMERYSNVDPSVGARADDKRQRLSYGSPVALCSLCNAGPTARLLSAPC